MEIQRSDGLGSRLLPLSTSTIPRANRLLSRMQDFPRGGGGGGGDANGNAWLHVHRREVRLWKLIRKVFREWTSSTQP